MSRSIALVCALVLLPAARGMAIESAPAAISSPIASPAAAPSPAPADLVAAALQAGLAGDASRRGELIAQALAADPDYAPARWLNGEVRFEGRWRDLVEVSSLIASDRRWAEYRDLRKETPDTPAGHLELASWCYRNGLENEERHHWARVLAADPQHELARTRLGLAEYHGGLATHEQIAADQRQRKQAARDLARYRPQFDEICQRVLDGDSAERGAALAELRAVTDPAAIESLERAVAAAASDAFESLAVDLQLAYIGALSNIREHAATLKLLDASLFAAQRQVRHAAAQSLRTRPVTDYVPLLMATLAAPIKAKISFRVQADGDVGYRERLFQAGPEADRLVKRDADFDLSLVGAAPRTPQGRQALLRRVAGQAVANRNMAAAHAWQTRQAVAVVNEQSSLRNERVQEVLHIALDMESGAEPQTYWQQWTSYNELAYEEHPVYTATDYAYFSTPVVAPAEGGGGSSSCFKAGTPVWTQSGLTPIERIKVGDVVLAQHPITGELAFRPVLQTTVGPPVETIDISLPGEVITATRGHRFWANGQGWRMAKELQPSSTLHALDAPAKIAALTTGQRQRCHNLVVDDFHTFFVGESRLLVHDKTCPQPTTALAPGFAAPKPPASTSALLGNVAR